MRKKAVLLIFLQIFLLGCKSSTNENENALAGSSKDTLATKRNNTPTKESFTIVCGSACVMTYNEEARKTNKNSVEIKYKITQYIDEKIEDEYFETYIFESDENRNLKSIHLNKGKDNILNDSNSLLREEFLEIGMKVYPKSTAKKTNLGEIAFVADYGPYQLMDVPFDLKEYLNNLPNQIKNGYIPSVVTEKYLSSIGYEGEKYKCFFIKKKINSVELIVSVSRGDSEYFLLLKADRNRFLSYEEIGDVGGEDAKYFKIDERYNVVSY